MGCIGVEGTITCWRYRPACITHPSALLLEESQSRLVYGALSPSDAPLPFPPFPLPHHHPNPQTRNPVWKRNRNAYARLLLLQLRSGEPLAPPFSALPPEGPLTTLEPRFGWAGRRGWLGGPAHLPSGQGYGGLFGGDLLTAGTEE